MPTFSQMFPSYARFFSGIGRLVSNARPRGKSQSRFAPHYPVSTIPSHANRQEDHYSSKDPNQELEEFLGQLSPQPGEQPAEGRNVERPEAAALPAASGTPDEFPGDSADPGAAQESRPQETSPDSPIK